MTAKTRRTGAGRASAAGDRPKAEPGLWATSALRRTWLVWFRGYTVSQTHIVPRNNLFNEIVYRKRWYLVRRNHPQR